jgi:4-amino-4-deoxy-L-arabinose transferase-like glycosyltransferase
MRSFPNSDEIGRVDRIVNSSKLNNLVLVLILSGAFSLYLATLTPSRFGAYYDDSIYVTTAKALATGQGYRIISLPHEPSQTLYPPFYSFLLSIVWRIYPQFPENIFWMLLLSTAATVTFLALTYYYLTSQEYATAWQALAVVAIAGINWRTMLLATTLVSELMYAVLSIMALHLAEKYEKERAGWIAGTIVGVAIGLAFLTRSSGIAVLIAVGLYYALQKQWRRGVIAIGVASLFVIGWSGWCYLNRNAVAGLNAAYFTNYWHVFSESHHALQALNNTSPAVTFFRIIGTNILLLLITSPALACFGLRYDFPPVVVLFLVFLVFITIVTGLLKRFKNGPRLLDTYVCFYFLLHLIPAGVAYDRYLLPIVPFLLYYIVSEAGEVTSAIRRGLSSDTSLKKISAACVAFALFVVTVTLFYGNASAIYESLAPFRKKHRGAAVVDAQAIEWVNANTSRSDVLVCYRDPMYYLYTGRKAVISSPLIIFNTVPYQARQPNSDELRAAFLRLVDESNGNYLILSREDFKFESDQYRPTIDELIEERPGKFIQVFNTEDGQSKIYRIENNTRR